MNKRTISKNNGTIRVNKTIGHKVHEPAYLNYEMLLMDYKKDEY
jgi:hypothetical protein